MTATTRTLFVLILAPACLAGIAVALARLDPELGWRTVLIAGASAGAGSAAFWILQKLARMPRARDSPLARHTSWLWLAALVAVPLVEDLPESFTLVLLFAAAGYFATTLGFVARRLLRFRAARASSRRGASGA